MSSTASTTRGLLCFAVSFQLSAIGWALTPPIEIYSSGNTLANSSADQPISLQAQANLSTVANQTTLLLSTAPTSFQIPPQLPWLMEIGGTPYSIKFTKFKEAIAYFEVLDLLYDAQYDIMQEMAATYPSRDQSIGQRAWMSDNVHLSISSYYNRIVHSVCGLYLVAMIKLWGSEYGFYEADFQLLGTLGAARLPEIIGYGQINSVGGTVET